MLEKEKHVPNKYNGLIVSLASFFYVITTGICGFVIDRFPKRVFILMSFVFSTFALFLMGPSAVLGLPNELWIFLIGYGGLGASLGFIFIPILPEVIDSIYLNYDIKEG